jgi:formylglycine-generating enzyme required for sulfatase activity|tara:strand:- start:29 stop:934 length:906 start_codon:yes stop_codon:yes gene_type:complete
VKFTFLVLLPPLWLSACGQKPAGESGGSPKNEVIEVTTKSGIAMIYIGPGDFTMGTAKGDPDEAPAHTVQLAGFLMDKFEVTHALYAQAELPNPSHWQDDPRKPVEQVRWRGARLYCNERSLMEELQPCYDETKPGLPRIPGANGYRLPTEAEWEYAARAGSKSDYSFGKVSQLRQYAWFAGNSGKRTHRVGTRRSNAWGLHDLYGNVSEWCEDVYRADYYSGSPKANPGGPAVKGLDPKRVIRGGSWRASEAMCRVTFRRGEKTGDTDACFFTDYCGFRCVRTITPGELKLLQAQGPAAR